MKPPAALPSPMAVRTGDNVPMLFPAIVANEAVTLWAQPVAELGVDEYRTSRCLVRIRHQNAYLDCTDGALEDAHVAIGDVVRDAGPAE